MQSIRQMAIFTVFALLFSSCSLLKKDKYGCGDNGKNVGAEKLLDGSATKKQPKFKA
jgi:hypothetical protein